MSDVTRLLDAAAAGDCKAAADLLPLVYDELRQLAAARMAAEPAPLARTRPTSEPPAHAGTGIGPTRDRRRTGGGVIALVG